MLYPTAGSRLFIADVPADAGGAIPATGWVEIGEVEALGLLGVAWDTDEVEVAIEHGFGAPLDVLVHKRARRTQPMQVVFGNDPSDAGQVILWKAAAAADIYPFRLELPDGGGMRQWLALVTSIAEVFDTANGIVRLQADLVPDVRTGIQRG